MYLQQATNIHLEASGSPQSYDGAARSPMSNVQNLAPIVGDNTYKLTHHLWNKDVHGVVTNHPFLKHIQAQLDPGDEVRIADYNENHPGRVAEVVEVGLSAAEELILTCTVDGDQFDVLRDRCRALQFSVSHPIEDQKYELLTDKDLDKMAENVNIFVEETPWTGGLARTARCIWHGEILDPESFNLMPEWSPNGDKIAFASLTRRLEHSTTTWSVLHVAEGFVQDILCEPCSGPGHSYFHAAVRWVQQGPQHSQLELLTGHRRHLFHGEYKPCSVYQDQWLGKTLCRRIALDDVAKTSNIDSEYIIATHCEKDCEAGAEDGAAGLLFDQARHSCTKFSRDGKRVAMVYGLWHLAASYERTKNDSLQLVTDDYIDKKRTNIHQLVIGAFDDGRFIPQQTLDLPGALCAHSLDWSPDGTLLCVGVGGFAPAAYVYEVNPAIPPLTPDIAIILQEIKEEFDVSGIARTCAVCRVISGSKLRGGVTIDQLHKVLNHLPRVRNESHLAEDAIDDDRFLQMVELFPAATSGLEDGPEHPLGYIDIRMLVHYLGAPVQILWHRRTQRWDRKIQNWVDEPVWRDSGVTVTTFSVGLAELGTQGDAGFYLATGVAGLVSVFDCDDWNIVLELDVDEDYDGDDDDKAYSQITSLAWHPDTNYIAIGTHGVGIKVVHVCSGAVQASYAFELARCAWNPDGSLLACWNQTGQLAIFRHGPGSGGWARTVDISEPSGASDPYQMKKILENLNNHADYVDDQCVAKLKPHLVWSSKRRHCCMVREVPGSPLMRNVFIVSLVSGKVEYKGVLKNVLHASGALDIIWSPADDLVCIRHDNNLVFLTRKVKTDKYVRMVTGNTEGASTSGDLHTLWFRRDVGDKVRAQIPGAIFNPGKPHIKKCRWSMCGHACLVNVSADGSHSALRIDRDGTIPIAFEPGSIANSWSPNGKFMVVTRGEPAQNGELLVEIFEAQSNTSVRSISMPGEHIVGCAWGPSSRRFVICTESTAKLIVVMDASRDIQLRDRFNSVYHVAWNPYGDYAAIFDKAGVHCVNFPAGKIAWRAPGYKWPKFGPDWGPFGNRLIVFDEQNHAIKLIMQDGSKCPDWRCDEVFDISKWENQQSWEANPDGRTALVHHATSGRALILDTITGVVRRDILEGQEAGGDFHFIVWSEEGMKVQMADFSDESAEVLAIFDWCLCDFTQGDISSYVMSEWIKACICGQDDKGASKRLLTRQDWSTALFPRYGLHIAFLLALKGDASRLAAFAGQFTAIRRMFAVPVPVLIVEDADDDSNKKKKQLDSHAEVPADLGDFGGATEEKDSDDEGEAPLWVPRKDPAHSRTAVVAEEGVSKKVKNVGGQKWVWRYPIEVALERGHDDVATLMVKWMNDQRGQFIPSMDIAVIAMKLVQLDHFCFFSYLEGMFDPATLPVEKLLSEEQSPGIRMVPGPLKPNEHCLSVLKGPKCQQRGKKVEIKVYTLTVPLRPGNDNYGYWLKSLLTALEDTDVDQPEYHSHAIKAILDFLWHHANYQDTTRRLLWKLMTFQWNKIYISPIGFCSFTHYCALYTLCLRTILFTAFVMYEDCISHTTVSIISIITGSLLTLAGLVILSREWGQFAQDFREYLSSTWNAIDLACATLCIGLGLWSVIFSIYDTGASMISPGSENYKQYEHDLDVYNGSDPNAEYDLTDEALYGAPYPLETGKEGYCTWISHDPPPGTTPPIFINFAQELGDRVTSFVEAILGVLLWLKTIFFSRGSRERGGIVRTLALCTTAIIPFFGVLITFYIAMMHYYVAMSRIALNDPITIASQEGQTFPFRINNPWQLLQSMVSMYRVLMLGGTIFHIFYRAFNVKTKVFESQSFN